MGLETSDDAGVYQVRADLAVVNTVDFFPPIVDDPYTYGRIAAANALSDVYAMGGRPVTALNVMGVDPARIPAAAVRRILEGGAERVEAAGAVVVGGHTVADSELKYGMAVTGLIHPARIVRNGGARAGDILVLTKSLGTGIVATAMKRGLAGVREAEVTVASMVRLNDVAGSRLHRYGARACTDVTGFGLVGHASEMAAASSGVRVVLESAALPLLAGVARLVELGCVTGGARRNRQWLGRRLSVARVAVESAQAAALDPQTSGGLLVSLAPQAVAGFVNSLRRAGHSPAQIGRVEKRPARSPVLVAVE